MEGEKKKTKTNMFDLQDQYNELQKKTLDRFYDQFVTHESTVIDDLVQFLINRRTFMTTDSMDEAAAALEKIKEEDK